MFNMRILPIIWTEDEWCLVLWSPGSIRKVQRRWKGTNYREYQ